MNDDIDLRSFDPEVPTPADLGDLVAELKLAFLVPPDEEVARSHLAALAAAVAPEELAANRTRHARRRGRILVPIGVVGGLILASSGLAAAGVLPAPLQHAVAAVASPFGFDLPTGTTEDGPSQPKGAGSSGADTTPTRPATSGDPEGSSTSTSSPPESTPTAPGHGGTNPGKSDQAPGQQTDPGASGTAPGHGGTNPGKSGQAPGHQTDPGPPVSAPGHGGTNPGKSGPDAAPPSTNP